MHQSRMEHQYSDPYEKRPVPYTARTKADYKAYKHPSDVHGSISQRVKEAKNINVGEKTYPEDSHRDGVLTGLWHATAGRNMANL